MIVTIPIDSMAAIQTLAGSKGSLWDPKVSGKWDDPPFLIKHKVTHQHYKTVNKEYYHSQWKQ